MSGFQFGRNGVRAAALAVAVLPGAWLACPSASADSETSLGYNISLPTAGTRDFLQNASFLGIGFGTRSNLGTSNKLSLGFSAKWLYFRQTDENLTFESQGFTVTANRYRSIDAIPLLIDLGYQFSDTAVRPFISMGAGALYAQRRSEAGIVQDYQVGWQFMLAPEVGVRYLPNSSTGGAILSARYDAGFGSDAIDAISYLSFQIGIVRSW